MTVGGVFDEFADGLAVTNGKPSAVSALVKKPACRIAMDLLTLIRVKLVWIVWGWPDYPDSDAWVCSSASRSGFRRAV